MINGTDLTPGCQAFWEDFYDAKEGRLIKKQMASVPQEDDTDLLDHYEWFVSYEKYEKPLKSCLDRIIFEEGETIKVVHPGCGNSNFCDMFADTCRSRNKKQRCDVLNMDICGSIITRLANEFPSRVYGRGDCCNFVCEGVEASSGSWYSVDPGTLDLKGVQPRSADMVFDKGTIDALLSAFPDDFNPNVDAYAQQILSCLKEGGVFFVISNNAVDVLNQYVLSVCDEDRSFKFVSKSEIDLSQKELLDVRVETLGSHYNVCIYQCVKE